MINCCKGDRHSWRRHRDRDRDRDHKHHDWDRDRDRDDFRNHGPFVLLSSSPKNGATDVSPNIKAIKLFFGRRRSRDDDDRGACNVFNEIDMWRGKTEVPIRIRRDRGHDGRRVIKVIPIGRLRAGVTYKVRVKSFFIDRHGNHFSRCKLIVFKTGCR